MSEPDREALLDQLARIFASAAVDELLAEQDAAPADDAREEHSEAEARHR